jgi:imidazoleglycerol-phosphate dehydratase
MRKAEKQRNTLETKISGRLLIDGSGKSEISTGIAFFDHMLDSFARHGGFDLTLSAQGDLDVDAHHTVEDTGLVLGTLLKDALGERRGIQRFGSAYVPMDEALARVVVDISGRPHLSYDVDLEPLMTGGMNVMLFREFFQAFANSAGITLNVCLVSGDEPHHAMEAVFKALAKALDGATRVDPRSDDVPSTKGTLD